MPNHVRTLLDLGPEEILYVLGRADQLKQLRGKPAHPQALLGKSVAVVFEKASTRTRISFDVGIKELGGHPVVLFSRDTQIDRGESVEDTAHMLSGYVHAIVYRTFGHDRIERMAATASVPVINALSDKFHPCQVLADLMTIRECNGGHLEGVRVAWVGDGNNMANSWIYAAALTGLDLVLACPEGYDPAPDVVAYAKQAKKGKVTIVRDVAEAVRSADVVTTDVWTSMGQEAETEARKRAFAGYLIDDAKMKTAKPSAIFLHCLPAHRGEEVAASVIDGAQSRVWQEAENRLHAQKALLEWVMEE